jgi:predicted nucleic-acid-binding Zn-ribbon protein
MKKSLSCPKCGGTDVAADAKVIDRGENHFQWDLHVATYAQPDALLFKGKQESKVSAWVCTDCGYLELYADHPAQLKVPKR